MAQIPTNLASAYPKRYVPETFMFVVSRGEAASTVRGVLPKGAIPIGLTILGNTGVTLSSTAVINVGVAGNNTYYLTGQSVLGAAGVGQIVASAAVNLGQAVLNDTTITSGYAETGTASGAGGPWVVIITFIRVGPGEYSNSTGRIIK